MAGRQPVGRTMPCLLIRLPGRAPWGRGVGQRVASQVFGNRPG